MTPTLRDATPEDRPVLEIVRQQAVEAAFSDVYDREDFADLVARPHPDLPAWIEGSTVTVSLLETPITPVCFGAYRKKDARVLALYTAPDYQGRGLASRLLNRFLDRARETGQSQLNVHAPRNAVDFFEHRGFYRQDELTRRGLALIEMIRPLS